MKVKIFLFTLLMLVFIPSCAKPGQKTITLKPCLSGGSADRCGKLTVYENRAARSGRTIDLNIRVIKAAHPQSTKEAVFMLSGGPGVAATTDSGNLVLAQYAAEDHDIVLVDQRGTGGSNEVYPPQTPDWSGLCPSELEKAYAAWIKQMLPTLGADPRYYTTSVAMDDLDDVRQALGYDRIDLMGGSYGTTAAQYYLRQHEQPVRSVVLLFNGELDPIDPPANTTRAKEICPNSLSLVLPWQGHSLSNGTVVSCVVQITKKFIADASVQNLPTDCLKNIRPPAFDINE